MEVSDHVLFSHDSDRHRGGLFFHVPVSHPSEILARKEIPYIPLKHLIGDGIFCFFLSAILALTGVPSFYEMSCRPAGMWLLSRASSRIRSSLWGRSCYFCPWVFCCRSVPEISEAVPLPPLRPFLFPDRGNLAAVLFPLDERGRSAAEYARHGCGIRAVLPLAPAVAPHGRGDVPVGSNAVLPSRNAGTGVRFSDGSGLRRRALHDVGCEGMDLEDFPVDPAASVKVLQNARPFARMGL